MKTAEAIVDEVIYEKRFLNETHLEEAMKLQHFVAQNEKKGLFCPMPRDYVLKQLRERLNCIGVFADKKLIALHMISFPQTGEENFGLDIDLPSEEIGQVAHLGAVAIHPEHRGRGLHNLVGDYHLEIIRCAGYRHVCATAAPENYLSLKFLTERGFEIRRLCKKYGDYLRFVLQLDLKKQKKVALESVNVPCDDFAAQQNLLVQGYRGIAVEKEQTGFSIKFVKE